MAFVGQQMNEVQTHVQIIYGQTVLEMSFWLFAGVTLFFALIFYLFVKIISLFKPIDAYQRWKEKREIKRSARFLKEGVFLWFDGRQRYAEQQLRQALNQQPILARIMLAYVKQDYDEVEISDDRFQALLNFLHAQYLLVNNDSEKAFEIIKNDSHAIKKQPLYMALAFKIGEKQKQFEWLSQFFSEYSPEHTLSYSIESAACAYLKGCEVHKFGHERILSSYKQLNKLLANQSTVLSQYASSVVALLDSKDSKRILLKLAKKDLPDGVVTAFQTLEISDEEKLDQLEMWNKQFPDKKILLLALSQCSHALSYQTKAQQYQLSYESLEK